MRDVIGIVLFVAVSGFLFIMLIVPILVIGWSIIAAILGVD